MTNKVRINGDYPYDVIVENRIIDRAGEYISSIREHCSLLIVTDDRVDSIYSERLIESLEKKDFSIYKYVFPNGEKSKNFRVTEDILNYLSECGFDRSDMIIAFGGGVCGDLAGFAASIYLRGIEYIQIPTTLLAMIDSSVGGKTGCNMASGKNMAGTFYQPQLVLCDTGLLDTLDEKEMRSGRGEMLKYSILSGKLFSMDYVSEEDIVDCIEIKKAFVEGDIRDLGKRRYLNLGHTIGHAIEAYEEYSVPHGVCVVHGILAAARLFNCDALDEIKVAAGEMGIEEYDVSKVKNQLLKFIENDKKKKGDSITFAVPERMGECTLKSISIEELRERL